jgi:tetratricopeptide (TPR) repeat protein
LADSFVAFGWHVAQAGKISHAIDYYTRELAIRQKLAQSNSAILEDRDALANCLTNIADLLHRSAKLDEALAACERSLAVREPLVKEHAEVAAYRASLGETYMRLGQVRCDMDQLAESATAFRHACALYGETKRPEPQHMFLMACCHAGLAGLAGRPGAEVSAAEGIAQAERAMAVLRHAVAAGYRNPDAYKTESGLDPLRSRADFQTLIMDLLMPAQPFVP